MKTAFNRCLNERQKLKKKILVKEVWAIMKGVFAFPSNFNTRFSDFTNHMNITERSKQLKAKKIDIYLSLEKRRLNM